MYKIRKEWRIKYCDTLLKLEGTIVGFMDKSSRVKVRDNVVLHKPEYKHGLTRLENTGKPLPLPKQWPLWFPFDTSERWTPHFLLWCGFKPRKAPDGRLTKNGGSSITLTDLFNYPVSYQCRFVHHYAVGCLGCTHSSKKLWCSHNGAGIPHYGPDIRQHLWEKNKQVTLI